MTEVWDLYDSNKRESGRLHKRGASLSKDEYHLVAEIWVINSNRQVLLTQRHPNKRWGSYWECPGGAILAGESAVKGAMRELYEETGINIPENDLVYLGSQRYMDWFTESFLVKTDRLLSDLELQISEVINAKWVDFEEFDDMHYRKIIVPFTAERFSLYRDKLGLQSLFDTAHNNIFPDNSEP